MLIVGCDLFAQIADQRDCLRGTAFWDFDAKEDTVNQKVKKKSIME